MKKISKSQSLKFLFFLALCTFTTVSLSLEHGIYKALHIMFLLWSFYILCIPSSHGKNLISTPMQMIKGKKLFSPEITIWSGAVLLNVLTYFIVPTIYFSNLLTHLLFRIISNPWPYWSIILVCAMGTFYKPLIGVENFRSKKVLHYPIRLAFITCGIFTFIYLSYQELVILLNVRS